MNPHATLPSSVGVLVVGAGLSGLSCARLLTQAGIDVHVVDASDAVGGRIRTDEVEGFRLDRGFQVLLTAYEEAQAQLDLPALDLRAFKAGSLIWNGSALQTMSDPFRDPARAIASLRAPVGSLGDKLKVAALRHRLTRAPASDCFGDPERTTQGELESLGFSGEFIDLFFRPFLGGVYLERSLETSSSLFRYYFRCFATGDAVVPAFGMQRVPEMLASALEGRVTLGTTVKAASAHQVSIDGGRTIKADDVVIAVDGASASRLLRTPSPVFKPAITSYFAAEQAPTPESLLILDGEGAGPANHVAVMSNVAPEYAPAGAHLMSVSGVESAASDPEAFRRGAVDQLKRWFGPSVSQWRHLESYVIPQALPRHPPGSLRQGSAVRRLDGMIVAGDYTEFGAIQGALLSGRRAAESILQSRGV